MKFLNVSKFFTIFTFLLLSYSQLVNLMKLNSNVKKLENQNQNHNQNQVKSGKEKEKEKENKKLETKKKFELEIDPMLEDDNEKFKLISNKFLGSIVPKEEIDCNHINFNNPISNEIRKACNIKSLIQITSNIKQEAKTRNIDCNAQTCLASQGKCNSEGVCICQSGWLNDPNLKVNKYCSYKQKLQMQLFLIEFFAPFGLGFILYGNFFYGIIKLSVFAGLILIDLISKCILLCRDSRGAKFPNYMTLFYYLILVFWQLYDMTMIGFNKVKDNNGMPYLPVEKI
jgi:hypothetical protein